MHNKKIWIKQNYGNEETTIFANGQLMLPLLNHIK